MTASQLSVRGQATAVLTEVVASLPVSFAFAEGDVAEVRVVVGAGDWVEAVREAIADGLRGVIVVDPTIVPSERVRALAAEFRVPVVLSESWAGNPTITRVRDQWAEGIAGAATIESTVSEPIGPVTNAELVLRQLRTLRHLGVVGAAATQGSMSDRAYSLAGKSSAGQQIALFGVRSSGLPPSLTVSASGRESTVRMSLPAPTAARPAIAQRVTSDGGDLLPTMWETAHRAAFRRIHTLVTSGGESHDLEGFAADLDAARKHR